MTWGIKEPDDYIKHTTINGRHHFRLFSPAGDLMNKEGHALDGCHGRVWHKRQLDEERAAHLSSTMTIDKAARFILDSDPVRQQAAEEYIGIHREAWMTYIEFIKGICKHPKGWRYECKKGDINLDAPSCTTEERRIVNDFIHVLYDTFVKDPGAPARMLSNKSDLVTAAVQVWLEQ